MYLITPAILSIFIEMMNCVFIWEIYDDFSAILLMEISNRKLLTRKLRAKLFNSLYAVPINPNMCNN